MKCARFVCPFILFAITTALAQVNPVPLVNQPLVPTATAPGGPGFTLTVNGTGFASTSVVNWNSTPLSTTFVSSSQSTATVPASNIDSASGERLLRLGNGERTERRQSLTPRQGDLAGRLAESGASRFDSDRVRRYIR